MDQNFSWVKEINSLRTGTSELENIISNLRKEKIQGFEIELLGRKLSNLTNKNNLKKIKVAILSSNASQPIANAMRIACLKEYFHTEIYESPFGSINQEIINSKSNLYKFDPDLILLDLDINFFNINQEPNLISDEIKESLEKDIAIVGNIWKCLKQFNCPIIQNTLVLPPFNYLGMAEYSLEGGINWYITTLNNKLLKKSESTIYWLDLGKLSQIIGLKNWHDSGLFYQAKYGFSIKFLPEYTNWLSSTIREVYALKPKVLILDLDNTLWGGIIGDDGLEGINLGPETPEGNAFQDFCYYLKALKSRGIILAICSKNEISNVKEVFNRHPHMPLSLDDFSCIKCNWDHKPKNIIEIANELNLDISSFVFVDDNPAECELVRSKFKEVKVIQLSNDPSTHISSIDFLNLFNSYSLSKEDLIRHKSYIARTKYEKDKLNFSNIDEYLIGMKMTSQIKETNSEEIHRICQMQMKTNQFNLKTHRHSKEEILTKIKNQNQNLYSINLKDKFADHGLVSYIEYEYDNQNLIINDWLMSCRVFSRTLEEFILKFLINQALNKNKKSILLNYSETNKNKILKDIFIKLGFNLNQKKENNQIWSKEIKDLPNLRSFIN